MALISSTFRVTPTLKGFRFLNNKCKISELSQQGTVQLEWHHHSGSRKSRLTESAILTPAALLFLIALMLLPALGCRKWPHSRGT